MLTRYKQLTVLLLLSSLLLVTFSSLAMVTHEPASNLAGACPFSGPGMSLCPQNLLAATIHHLSAYYSFFNVPLSLGSTLSISLLLILCFFVLISSAGPPQLKLTLLTSRFRTSPPIPSRDRQITCWLALLENSPTSL